MARRTSMPNTPVQVIYKRAEVAGSTLSLQQLLAKALERVPKPVDRRQPVGGADDASDILRVIGKTRSVRNLLCGTFMYYEQGKDVTLILEDEAANDFEIEAEHPGYVRARRREVVQSVLHFGVWSNHILVCQSGSLRSRQLEDHLNWLLRERLTILPGDGGVSLNDEPTQEARERLENTSIKAVEIGIPVYGAGMDAVPESDELTGQRFWAKTWQTLGAFLSKETLVRLDLESALEEPDLAVKVQLRYKRDMPESGSAALDRLARAMRHTEPEAIRIIPWTGPPIPGRSLRIVSTLNVATENGVIIEDDLFEQFRNWLDSLIDQDIVA